MRAWPRNILLAAAIITIVVSDWALVRADLEDALQ